MNRVFGVVIMMFSLMLGPDGAEAKADHSSIHHLPVIVQGNKILPLTRYPIGAYRIFKTGPTGEAIPIPFQIDEINESGDYILTYGKNLVNDKSNGIFDLQDEIAFMGDDVGPAQAPTKWRFQKPAILRELRFSYQGKNPIGPNEGAVYIGIYFKDAPPLSTQNYVVFKKNEAQVLTSRFRYKFDKENYLVVEGVDMVKRERGKPDEYVPIIKTSTFYMKADLKYFLTFEVNHRDINSSLEAYKPGPIRTIVRVTFFYQFLKINFELGMYTEVSIFSNAVLLPAIIHNPLDGNKNLNNGSGFYYGFAINDKPKDYQTKTNIPEYEKSESAILDFFKPDPKAENLYWLSMSQADRMMYFEIVPSKEMVQKNNIPKFYRKETSGEALYKNKAKTGPAPLGKAPVNLALYFDMTKFNEGDHKIAFRLFFENRYDETELTSYPQMSNWDLQLRDL